MNHEEADHRIANHLSLLASVVSLRAADLARQSADPSRTQVQLLLQAFRAQLDAVARLHRLLTVVGSGIAIDLGEQLHEVCTLVAAAVGDHVELTEGFEEQCSVRSDHLLPITHIVAEVLTNAIKYAHPPRARCRIMASCRHDAAGSVVIEIDDDGVGLPEGFDPEHDGGLGLRIVRGLAKQLGGNVAFEPRAPGVRFRLTMGPVQT